MRIRVFVIAAAGILLTSCNTIAAISSSTQDKHSMTSNPTTLLYSPDARHGIDNNRRFLRAEVAKDNDEEDEGIDNKEDKKDDDDDDEERALPAMGSVKDMKSLKKTASILVHGGATPSLLKDWLGLAKLPRSNPKWATYSAFLTANKAQPDKYGKSLLREVLKPKTTS